MADARNRSHGPLPECVLGPDHDLPIPLAVFRVDVDAKAGVATDAHFAYASKDYCRAISREFDGIVGRSLLEVAEGDAEEWLARCYRAVVLGETVSGFWYDQLARDWTSFTMGPSGVPGCCTYAFIQTEFDEQQRQRLMAAADARTSRFISEMLSDLAAEQDYHAAMDGMLAKMSEIIHAERLSVFEFGPSGMQMTFELLDGREDSQLGSTFNVPKEMLSHWFKNVTQDRVILVPNVSVIERFSEPLYRWCRASGVDSLLAAPFFGDDEIVGFLGAYNYRIDENVDLNRLFEAVSTFIAARIENRQLIESLRRASSHDTLTGLLNRRGSQQAIRDLLARSPQDRHVLALLDIDDFKRVNDVYGHNAGDEALKAMARTLERTFPTDAIVSRNGGDEFLVMLSGDAARDASRLLAGLAHEGLGFTHEGERRQATISAGYARYPEQADNIRALFSMADAALYAVKLSGKAGFGKYTADAEDRTRLRLGFSARDILENSPYRLLVTRADERGEILFASSRLAHMLGYAGMYDLLRSTGGSYAGIVHPEDQARVRAEIERKGSTADPDDHASVTFRAVKKCGDLLEVSASFRFASIEDSGRVLYTHFM